MNKQKQPIDTDRQKTTEKYQTWKEKDMRETSKTNLNGKRLQKE